MKNVFDSTQDGNVSILTNDRPYRRAVSPEAACQRIREKAGSQFDQVLVELFLSL